MLELLQKLFIGHAHSFEIIHRAGIARQDENEPYGFLFVLQCKECGIVKHKKILAFGG